MNSQKIICTYHYTQCVTKLPQANLAGGEANRCGAQQGHETSLGSFMVKFSRVTIDCCAGSLKSMLGFQLLQGPEARNLNAEPYQVHLLLVWPAGPPVPRVQSCVICRDFPFTEISVINECTCQVEATQGLCPLTVPYRTPWIMPCNPSSSEFQVNPCLTATTCCLTPPAPRKPISPNANLPTIIPQKFCSIRRVGLVPWQQNWPIAAQGPWPHQRPRKPGTRNGGPAEPNRAHGPGRMFKIEAACLAHSPLSPVAVQISDRGDYK